VLPIFLVTMVPDITDTKLLIELILSTVKLILRSKEVP
jgi:hypothetical protein